MVGATDNEGMWEGLRAERPAQIKRLNFSQMKDSNLYKSLTDLILDHK